MDLKQDVRYPNLYSALALWTERALPLLQARMERRPLETRDSLIWAPRLMSEAFDPNSPIHVLPETQELGQAIANMPQFVPASGTNEDWYNNPIVPPIQASLEFGYFLYAYIGNDLDWRFNRRRFDRVYQDFESLLDDPGSISIAVRIELWNLNLTHRKIRLADGVTIRPLTATERKRHVAASLSTGRFGPSDRFDYYKMDPPVPALYLELTRTVRAYETVGRSLQHALHFYIAEAVRRAAHDTLLGLRLLTEGDFGIGLYDVVTDNRLLRVDGPTALSVASDWRLTGDSTAQSQRQRPVGPDTLKSAWASYSDGTPLGPPVMITVAKAQQLQRLWPLLQQNVNKKLVSALHRFELSYDRTNPEDRLIDYWVALEALFLQGNDRELSRAACQRLAFFIESTRSHRFRVYDDAKKSYGFRSSVVHGNRYDPAKVEVSVNFIAGYLRRALAKCLKMNAPPDKTALDKAMMGSTQ